VKARAQHRAAALGISLVVLALLIVAHGHRLAETGRTTLRVPALDLTTWTRIAGDLEDRVPARFLLGASGPNEALDNLLLARGVRRVDFQRAASLALRRVGESTDLVAREALSNAFAEFPLPDGIEIPVSLGKSLADHSPELDEARRLVLTLTARIDAPVQENETL
jgi:hypothetical protein